MRFILAVLLLSPMWLLAQVPFDVYSCVNLIEFREAHEMVSLGIEGLEEEWSWLAIGGSDGDQALATVELGMSAIDGYEPESWFPVASMSTARQDFQAFGFGGAKALVLGGYDGIDALSTTEFYDVSSDVWTAGPEMSTPRTHHRAVWMGETKLLITGGFNGVSETASCEILDVVSFTVTEAAPMLTARASHTLTPLGEGKFLAAGGFNAAEGFQLSSCEVYDALTDTWSAVAALPVARDNHAAWTLPASDGENGVILTGGRVFDEAANLFTGLAEGAIYDPASATWTAFDMASRHSYHGMARMGEDANWFALGGVDESGAGVTTTYGQAEWGSGSTSMVWEPGPIGTGQNPGLLENRFKAAMAPSWAGWVVTGGDAGGIGTCAVVVGPTSFVEESESEPFTVFPNPAVGRTVLHGTGANPEWTLRNAMGQSVRQGVGTSFDVTGLPSGGYLLHVEGVGTRRLVVR